MAIDYYLEYIPFNERQPDTQYRELLQKILKHGKKIFPQQEETALRIIGHQMHFDLRNGFPLITERDLITASGSSLPQVWQAFAELIAFLHGARTQKELESFGCRFWKRWITQEKCEKRGLGTGDLGPGSYGAAWRNFPSIDGSTFDQITHLIEQIKELPHLRTHFVSPWIPQYCGRGKGKIQRVVVAPCHGWIHVFADPSDRALSLHHFQRSADTPVGLVFNIAQYALLTIMIAQVVGYCPHELVYTISDAHIFEKQIPAVNEILATEPQRFPTLTVNPDIKNIFNFRPEHITVSDYYPRLGRRVIWTPV